MSPITMSSSPTVIFHRHQQSTLVLFLLLSILLYISPIHCVKPKGESKALLRVLNDVDNVLSKETKVLEELQANRFKEKKYYEIVDGDCKLEPHYQNVVIIVSVSRMHNIKILAKIHAFAKKI